MDNGPWTSITWLIFFTLDTDYAYIVFKDQNDSRFYCSNNFCGRSYKSRRSLWRHLKNECGVQPKFNCCICNKKFSDKQSMKRHTILVHKHLL
ncbi:PR domain zinc finger protein 5-like [Rhopalosiphum maidis]|uniref:PR domain zinc finger protein 5-like n=1 Tax=Rhopalosiphum maidis TaxID=43146 RepID=UPI000EFF5AAA|nr:PR domain zinc finger protein 5-like [Rhopalosiphum maidis]